MHWNLVSNKTNMENLPIIDAKYQVFIFTCPAQIPFHFAVHPWIVIVNDNAITRWEIVHRKYTSKERFGYIYKNFYHNPTQGLKKSPISSTFWNSRLVGSISGNEKSLAKRIVDLVENPSAYPQPCARRCWPYEDGPLPAVPAP